VDYTQIFTQKIAAYTNRDLITECSFEMRVSVLYSGFQSEVGGCSLKIWAITEQGKLRLRFYAFFRFCECNPSLNENSVKAGFDFLSLDLLMQYR